MKKNKMKNITKNIIKIMCFIPGIFILLFYELNPKLYNFGFEYLKIVCTILVIGWETILTLSLFINLKNN